MSDSAEIERAEPPAPTPISFTYQLDDGALMVALHLIRPRATYSIGFAIAARRGRWVPYRVSAAAGDEPAGGRKRRPGPPTH